MTIIKENEREKIITLVKVYAILKQIGIEGEYSHVIRIRYPFSNQTKHLICIKFIVINWDQMNMNSYKSCRYKKFKTNLVNLTVW